MKILLDTNFILTCVKQKIDFVEITGCLIDKKIEWLVPQQVLNELGYLKDRPGMKTKDREAASMSFEILQQIDSEIVDTGKNRNVDIGIVNYIMDKEIVLATLDRELQSRVKNHILTIKGRDFLELK